MYDSDIAEIQNVSQEAVRQQRYRGRLPPAVGRDGNRVYTKKEDYLRILEKELEKELEQEQINHK